MGVEFNFIKIESNIFSVTYEVTKKTFCMVLLSPHWVFVIVTIATILANKETFPLHNLFQCIKNYFGGSWLKFALEFDTIIAGIFWLIALLVILEVIGKAIRNRNDCYSISYIPIHLLIQVANYEPAESLFMIIDISFKAYIYISAQYMNYLIMAIPNFSELNLLLNTDQTLGIAVMGTPMMLLIIIGNSCSRLRRFLLIYNL